MLDTGLLAVANIPVGDHIKRGPFNVDTIWTTALAAVVVLGLGFYMRRRVTAGVPNKVQVFWELVVGGVGDQVESSLGPKYRRIVPLGVAIFVVVLAADWVEVLPGLYHNSDYANSPSADVNLTYALGILVFVLTNVAGMRAKGVGRWAKDFVSPLHIIEHVTRPLTLADQAVRARDRLRHRQRRPDRDLEALRHVHRRDPGLHLHAAHHPVLPILYGGSALTRRASDARSEVGRLTSARPIIRMES
jgi:hypothetical protein